MDCPKCGTWNPDDKLVCWRCQAELPKPEHKKQRRPVVFLGLPIWTWILVALMLALWVLAGWLGPALVQ